MLVSCRKGPLSWHKERLETADISKPIIVSRNNEKYYVLDGIHRLEKAIGNQIESIPTKIINMETIASAKLNMKK